MACGGRVNWLVVVGLVALGLLVLRPVRVDRGLKPLAPPKEAGLPAARRPARPAPRIRVVPPKSRDADTWFHTGLSYLNAGNYEGAMDAFLQATQLEPDWARAHHNLGFAYDQLRRYEEAIASYKVAILLDSDEPETHNNLGSVYVKQDRHEDAVNAFRRAIELNPDHAEAHLNLGIAYLLLGRPDDARAVHRALTQLDRKMAEELGAFIEQNPP
jgi:Flp pilus assembly protein TadD